MKWAVLALALVLTGCTASTPAPSGTDAAATSTPTPTEAAVKDLVPVVPDALTAETAETETTRVADAIEALIDASLIIHVDQHEQLVPATDEAGEYYGILRTITLEQPTDPIDLATTIAAVMTASGWQTAESTNDGGISLHALGQSGWFVLVGGDSTVEGQSVLTLQVASPDLP